ncbi:putative Gamma-interferon-inducible lysosomal thiol reductase [Hypsibius exemplaris]|uniref:Gamma-interferon-inducible lysosomal thiol reductase n=1 Tax=Hypsibius exemplaris TaxID=2072580 RepID=A0A1W0X8S2_HYPEX|nr:putative Gamma-interferon-inducible lysosomal thiol reductase [Hypsibius exemplaris]
MSTRTILFVCLVALLSLWAVSGRTETDAVVDADGNWLEAHAPLVDLEVYYETLCPDSRNFIETQLYPTANKVGHVMNIKVYPYGKATEVQNPDKTWNYTCQHGPKECATNMLTTCALHFYSKHHHHRRHRLDKKLLDFIYCIENSEDPSNATIQEACAKKEHFSWHKLSRCAEDKLGNELEHRMGLKTEALNPALNWVPWIVVNGVHNGTIQGEAVSDLLKLVCDTYTGARPKACPTPLDDEE